MVEDQVAELSRWLEPDPIFARLKATEGSFFDDGAEIALLAVAVHKKQHGKQFARVALHGGLGEHFSRV